MISLFVAFSGYTHFLLQTRHYIFSIDLVACSYLSVPLIFKLAISQFHKNE